MRWEGGSRTYIEVLGIGSNSCLGLEGVEGIRYSMESVYRRVKGKFGVTKDGGVESSDI